MDNWILKGPSALAKEQQQECSVKPDEVKVKVTYVFASNYDAVLYSGELSTRYPKTIGRFAVGRVTEVGADCYGIEKNMRVLLKPARCCGTCIECKTGKESECSHIGIAGRDFDGFMRDFAVCKYTQVAPLPDSVGDVKALCTEAVALGEKIYNQLDLSAGQRVAVIGGSFVGNIIAQVLQYHKLVPIIIDNSPVSVERAKNCGFYYSFAADDDLSENIKEATCGQLCDAAVYTTCSRLDPSLIMRVIANGKNAVLAGFAPINFNIPSRDIMEKNATLFSVMNGYGYIDSAINLLVHGAVNTDLFEKDILTEFDADAVLKSLADINAYKRGKMIVFKLII